MAAALGVVLAAACGLATPARVAALPPEGPPAWQRTAVRAAAQTGRPDPQQAAAQAPLVDRVAAVVNREVISMSQLDRAVRSARAASTDPTEHCTPPDTQDPSFEARVLQCMIDDLLQFQHVRRFPQFDVLPEDIDAAYQRLRAQYPSSEEFLQALLQQRRTPEEVRYDLERGALIVNYVDVRYRGIVDVSEREVLSYYDEVLRPEMERRGEPVPPLEAVDDDIERILVETEVNRRVDEWIVNLRRRADINVYVW